VKRSKASRRGRRAGFTLIELLAALVIGAVVLVGIGALVRTVGLSFDRGTRAVGKAERVLLAVQRLGADFASVRYLLRQKEPGPALAALFTGRADGAVFVTAGHIAIGTRDDELVFLQVEETADGARLVRRRAAFLGVRVPLEHIVPGDPVVLLEGPLALSFAYSADTAPPLKWTDRWADEARPPRRVRLIARDRTTGADLLPPIVFAIRADAPPSCAAAEATATCIPAMAAASNPAPPPSAAEPVR
jgi:general secretion pathway protein J